MIPSVDDEQILKNYILSVSWRVIWDDIYRLNSFHGESYRSELEDCELSLRTYLLSGGDSSKFENKIFKLNELVQGPEALTDRVLFGYVVYNQFYGGIILTYYAGLVFVTRFIDERRMVISFDGNFPTIEEVVSDELIYMFTNFQNQLKIHYTAEFQDKMRKRYKYPT